MTELLNGAADCGYCGAPLGETSDYHEPGCQEIATESIQPLWRRLNAAVTAAGDVELGQYAELLKLLSASLKLRFARDRELPIEARAQECDRQRNVCRRRRCPETLIALAYDLGEVSAVLAV